MTSSFLEEKIMQETQKVNPCRSPYIVIIDRENMDKSIIYDKQNKKAYEFGNKETQVLKTMNGRKTYAQIEQELLAFTSQELQALGEIFKRMGLLKGYEKKEKVHLLKMKFALWNPSDGMKKCGGLVGVLYYIVMVLAFPLFILGIALNNMGEVYRFITENVRVSYVFYSLIFTFISVSVHELAHAAAAKKNGGAVAEIGIMFYYFFPCAYTTICGTNNIKKISKRVMITLAGMISNIFIMGVTLILFSFVQSDTLKNLFVCNLIANFLPVMSNFNIFFKFDLYYALTLILNKPYLREEAVGYMKGLIKKSEKEKGVLNGSVFAYGILMVTNLYAVPLVLLSYILDISNLIMKIESFIQ